MRPIADCSSARARRRAAPDARRARVTGAPPCPASWTRTTCITTPRASAYMWLGEKDSSACFSKRTRTTTSFSRRFRLPWGLGRPDTSEKAGRPRIASSWRFPRALAVAPKCGFTRCRTKDKRPVRSSVLQTHKLAYALLSALGWAGTVSGQSETAIIQQTARVANAIRLDHAPKIDGTLDDPLWKLAEPNTNFAQREPYEGQPPSERTEVRLLYTKGEIYFGIACFDSEPEKIVAPQLRRDISQELDDFFEIVIDSSHNRRNAYVFQFNPLGTQRDALITDEQPPQDDGSEGYSGWHGVWISVARITSRCWDATVR